MALWTTGRCCILGAEATIVGLLPESRVVLRFRLDPLLVLTNGSAVTLYVVVVTGPAEISEETLLRGLALLRGLGRISRREVGMTCI